MKREDRVMIFLGGLTLYFPLMLLALTSSITSIYAIKPELLDSISWQFFFLSGVLTALYGFYWAVWGGKE